MEMQSRTVGEIAAGSAAAIRILEQYGIDYCCGGSRPFEEVCRETYGVMVYQEQVMQAAKIIAGYTLGGADMLRRAMGKKDAEAMAKERAKFVEGAKRVNNIDAKTADSIFDILNKFAFASDQR